MTIFHNHIPRTSGGVINRSIKERNDIKKYIIEPTDYIDINKFYYKDYISGHIGQLPQKYIDDVLSFSFIRNPIDQWFSWFWLMYRQQIVLKDNIVVHSKVGSAKQYMEKFLYDEEFYNGTSNIQSKFLLGYVDISIWNDTIEPIEKTKSGWCLTGYDLKESEIDSSISNYIVGTVENRDYVINFINTLAFQKYNIKNMISEYSWKGHNTPKNNPLLFDIPKQWVQRVTDINEIDYYLYRKANEHSKKYAIMSL